jgi:hypothetical protein
MQINQDFARWAIGFSGMDGGNIHSQLWISGIEWGGNSPPSLFPTRFCYNENGRWIPCWNQEFRQAEPEYQGWQFDQKVAKIVLRLFGANLACNNYADYMRDYLYTQHGHCFKLNLYPLNAPNTNPELWDERYYKLTGFPTKVHYWSWCSENRFPFIKSLLEKYSPKVVIAAGSSFRRDYILAFGQPDQVFRQGIIRQVGNGHSVEEIVTNNNRTRLLITPFLGQGGIMADADLLAIADLVAGFL